MKITSAQFVAGVAAPRSLPKQRLPEIVFMGRSNVGKSTLLNALCNNRHLARISSTPGKTQQINFFLINSNFYFVDLPGYGYAKVSQEERRRWKQLIEGYLTTSGMVHLAVQLVDARRGVMDSDLMIMQWLENAAIRFVVVLTKADKISRGELAQKVRHVKPLLAGVKSCCDVIPFSAVSGEGKSQLLSLINAHLLMS
jgi:GTP-binding protein